MNKKEVIKHSSAIQISNKINLLERRSWNVLLANAFDDMKDKDIFKIPIKELANILEYDSNDKDYLKNILRKLNRTQIEWNILTKDKEKEWGVSTLLADARIINGECFYSYSPFMREKLHNPEMYARINLSLQNKFKSKHSLALYELFVDYYDEKRKYGETPKMSINELRKLLGLVSSEYKEFKFLKRDVINKAISEINIKSDILIESKFIKEGRKVVDIKFIIKRNSINKVDFKVIKVIKKEQTSLPLEEFELDNQELFIILTNEFGISKNKAINILKTSDEFYIQENLEIVRKGIKEGRIKNIPAYTVKALNEDFRSKKPKAQIEKEEKKNQRIIEEEKNKKMEELGNKIYKDFVKEEINPEIKLLVKELNEDEKLVLNNWISKNPVYKRYKNEEDYFKFNVYQSYFKKNESLNNIDERFITFATQKGYKVKKTSDIIDKWIASEE